MERGDQKDTCETHPLVLSGSRRPPCNNPTVRAKGNRCEVPSYPESVIASGSFSAVTTSTGVWRSAFAWLKTTSRPDSKKPAPPCPQASGVVATADPPLSKVYKRRVWLASADAPAPGHCHQVIGHSPKLWLARQAIRSGHHGSVKHTWYRAGDVVLET